MKTRHGYLLILLLCLSLLTTACSSEQAVVNTLPTPKPATLLPWQVKWLNNPTCQPPCWENITPGKTTPSAAVELLKQNPMFTLVAGDPYGDTQVTWNWQDASQGGKFSHNRERVQTIYPFSPVAFKLSDVIKVYGEPEYQRVILIAGNDQVSFFNYSITLNFYTKGFMLSTFGRYNAQRPEIDANLLVGELSLFKPEASNHPFYYESRWEGYRSFDYYCRVFGEKCPKLEELKGN